MASIWAKAKEQFDSTNPPPPSTVWADPDALASPNTSGMLAATPRVNYVPTDPMDQQILHDQKRLQQLQHEQATPWGSPENHPGKLGKMAHAFATLGNIAGDVLAPEVMARVPGTQLYRDTKEQEFNKRLGEEEKNKSDVGLQGEQAKEAAARVPLYGAQEKEAEERGNLTEEQVNLYKKAGDAMNSPDISAAFATLSDPNSSVEQQRAAYATISQSPIAMLPMFKGTMTGAGSLYRQGEQGNRVGGTELMPDATSPTGYSHQMYNRLGAQIEGNRPTEPTATNPLLLGPQSNDLMSLLTRLAGARAGATNAQGLTEIIDPNTNRVIGYLPKGQIAGATGAGATGLHAAAAGGLTPKPTGTTEGGAQAAATLQDMVQTNILPAVDAAAAANEMGPASGRVENFLLTHVGNPDSAAAKLQSQLNAVGPMLGRMYGYRSADYAKAHEDLLNTRMTPEAIKAYLGGVINHAKTVAAQGGMGPKGPEAPTPTSQGPQAIELERGPDGKLRPKGGK